MARPCIQPPITYEGVTKPVAEWAKEYNLKYYTLCNRINKGWSIETALTTPVLPVKSNAKKTYAEVKAKFEAEGYKLLSSCYINGSTPLDYECPIGHKHHINYFDFYSGNRCGKCRKNKLTYEDAKESFESVGYKLLSKEYTAESKYLDYECPQGHVSKTSLYSFRFGTRCPYCSKVAKPEIENIKLFFEKESYKLLSKHYESAHKKLDYICNLGHEHSISWSNFQSGKRCPTCANETKKEKKKIPFDKIRQIFEDKGWTLLTSDYVNSKHSLEAICPQGHKTKAYASLLSKGTDCRICSVIRLSGNTSPHWNHNKTPEERRIKRNIEGYKEWRKAVMSRDNYKCRLCSSKKNICAHHLYSYRDHPNLRLMVKNGLTLCKSCHDSFHTQYGRGGNTCEQMVEYIERYTPGGENGRSKASQRI